MKRIVTGLFAGLVFTLTACGVTEGTVTGKNHEPEHVEQQEVMEQDCDTKTYVSGGKTKTKRECHMEGTGEYEDVTIPAVYELELTNDGDTGTVEVTEDVFNSVEEGDYYKGE